MPSVAPDSDLTRPSPVAVRRRARGYRIAALVIFLIGLIGAGVVYWLGTRQPDLSNDPSMLGFNRATDRQMGMLYGKQGLLIEDFDEWLKQPGTQAILIIIAGAVLAAGCLFCARILEDEAKRSEASDRGQEMMVN